MCVDVVDVVHGACDGAQGGGGASREQLAALGLGPLGSILEA